MRWFLSPLNPAALLFETAVLHRITLASTLDEIFLLSRNCIAQEIELREPVQSHSLRSPRPIQR